MKCFKNLILYQLVFLTVLFISPSLSAQKYVQVWGDEFNTPGLPDSTKWSYEVGKIRNNELQYYTSKRLENARIEDTVLILEARKENFQGNSYTSASIISKGIGDWLYGKIEISAKVPGGKGTWPALWMLPTNNEYGAWVKSGEIDIMEYVGVEPQNFFFTTHFQGINVPQGQHGSSGSGPVRVARDPWNVFIKFTMIWTPDKIEWFANDIKFHEYAKPADDIRVWPFNKEFYLILNLAYGGTWGGYNGVDDTKLPHKFYIDYVRVYQLQETEGPFNLTITPSNHGKVEISPKLDFYPEGTEVMLTAVPDSGFNFKAWEYQSRANPFKLTINKNTKVAPLFYNPKELLTNGEFDKSWDPWSFYVDKINDISYSALVIDSAFVVNVTKTTGTDWQLGFQETGLSMKKGKYKLSFDAFADQQKTLLITVSKNYPDWGEILRKNTPVSNVKKKYEFILDMPRDDNNVRLYFGIGQFLGKFQIDNVSLTRIDENPSTGIEDSKVPEAQISVYPNPVKGNFFVRIPDNSEFKKSNLHLFTMEGKLLFETLVNGGETEISPGRVKPGIYILKVTSEKNSFATSVIFK